MSERKLASIQVVEDVQPIPGADNIEVCTVLGWHAVVLKGKVKPGDVIVYIEIDAIVPDIPVFEFMKDSKFRVKTKKLRGQVSQGLVMALDEVGLHDIYDIGEDVSDLLNIKKYEAPIPTQLQGQMKGTRPWFVPKTDELRLNSYPWILKELTGKDCYISTKYDGTSLSVYWYDGELGVCSRNNDMKETGENAYWRCARALNLEDRIKLLGYNRIVLQGELCGPGIQRNRVGLKDLDFFLFDIYYPDESRYAGLGELIVMGKDLLGLHLVDREYVGVYNFTLVELTAMAKGKYPGTNNNKEGIVIRPIEPYRLNGERVSGKVINVDYLLKDEE